MEPLAERLRPKNLDEVVGQKHLLGKGKILSGVLASGVIPNMVFYGPSGVGKTTVARIIAAQTNRTLHKLNGTTASTEDIRSVMSDLNAFSSPNGILLYLDEIQYLNKKQQQTLLDYIENGKITLIASTADNPYFCVYNAILSRSTVFEFKAVEPFEIEKAVLRAFSYVREEQGKEYRLEDGVGLAISSACGGDVRKAINTVELLALASSEEVITLEHVQEVVQKKSIAYDRNGDMHYDILSAFQKSIRGSDENAALHYLARLIHSGDLLSICRRLLVIAAEDIGLAYPLAIPVVQACVSAAERLGFPEARLPLAEAVILLATAPKSNSVISGIESAMADLDQGKTGEIPAHLKDAHYKGAAKLGRGLTYLYSHDYANNWVEQQYLPDEIKDAVYYRYGMNKNEQSAKRYWDAIKCGEKKN